MSNQIVNIAVSIEHSRGWGRCVCEGIAAYSHAHPEWRLSVFETRLPPADELKRYDGFLWAVSDQKVAAALVGTGRPVVDLVNDGAYPGTVGVGSNHLVCGQLAARHFITRHMPYFAFCGWNGLRFSDARRASYVKAVRLNHYDCSVYSPHFVDMRRYLSTCIKSELLEVPRDAKQLARWIHKLPKPVGVFCANDLRAWQLAQVCRNEGLNVPTDVAILGVDNDSVLCSFTPVPLSSVDTNTFETGNKAAAVLDELMMGRRSRNCSPVLVRPSGVITRASSEAFPVNPPWLADILVYIRANTVRALSATDIVSYAGRSYGAIENAFKRVLGTTVQREIMAARLDMAEHLLSTTQFPISQVAVKSGFRSHQYFNSCFVGRNKMSPGEWRSSYGKVV